jgi:hypothetical protein
VSRRVESYQRGDLGWKAIGTSLYADGQADSDPPTVCETGGSATCLANEWGSGRGGRSPSTASREVIAATDPVVALAGRWRPQ